MSANKVAGQPSSNLTHTKVIQMTPRLIWSVHGHLITRIQAGERSVAWRVPYPMMGPSMPRHEFNQEEQRKKRIKRQLIWAIKVEPRWAVYGVICDGNLSWNDTHYSFLWSHLPLEWHSLLIWLKLICWQWEVKEILRRPRLNWYFHTSMMQLRDWKMYV